MTNIGKGMVAGFVATLTLSAIILLTDRVTTPEFNPGRLLTIAASGMHAPLLGWTVHFFVGTVAWGIVFTFVVEDLPGPPWLRGLLFGTGIWILLTIFMVPLARIVPPAPATVMPNAVAVFGGMHGFVLPVEGLILHWIYGAVLGGIYGALSPGHGTATSVKP